MVDNITADARNLLDKTFLKSMSFSLDRLLNVLAKAAPEFRKELAKHDTTACIKLRDNSYGRLSFSGMESVPGKTGRKAQKSR